MVAKCNTNNVGIIIMQQQKNRAVSIVHSVRKLFSEAEGVPHSTVHIPHVLHIQCGGVGGYPSVAIVLDVIKPHVGRLVSIRPRRNAIKFSRL